MSSKPVFERVSSQVVAPELEEKILEFWEQAGIFEKSISQRSQSRRFVFYEGPPTANGEPGVHHVMTRVIKDLVCRYKTMKGYQVLRKAGWDTHGLPVEIEVEKELNIKSKEEIEKYGVEEILTISPHCYYVFKNEEPYKGLGLSVRHYTEALAEALEAGKLALKDSLKGLKVAYHDPCFLGKRSGVYEAPRAILEAIPGLELVEFERNRENSFCCGGGAGRVWTEEAEPEKRPSVARLREALELGVNVVATACPFCTCMLEDAAKVLDVEEKLAIKDICELLLQAL